MEGERWLKGHLSSDPDSTYRSDQIKSKSVNKNQVTVNEIMKMPLIKMKGSTDGS